MDTTVCEPFTELTGFDGYSEVMAHRTLDGLWVRFYVYRDDVEKGSHEDKTGREVRGNFPAHWQWAEGFNSLFLHLVNPPAETAVRHCRARGFRFS